MDVLDALSRFTFDARGEGALHLVAGGLAVMGVFSTWLLLGALRPSTRTVPELPRKSVLTSLRARTVVDTDPTRYARDAGTDPIGAWEKGRLAGRKCGARAMDDLFDRMHAVGLGEPRVVESRPNRKVVRLHDCRGCHGARGATALCHFERGFLEGAFGRMVETAARVVETRCRSVGDPWCEFEVTYA